MLQQEQPATRPEHTAKLEAVMHWFALASLSPVAVLVAACLWGGVWAWLALAYVTIFVRFMDRAVEISLPARDDRISQHFAIGLNIVLGLVHFPVLALGVVAISGTPQLTTPQALATALALGLYLGQVSNSNAHELIHSTGRWPRRLGIAVYSSMLFGHHASAHPRVHHIHVATDSDPNSAKLGEGFYRFWPRAWLGSFRAGYQAETDARSLKATNTATGIHPYVLYSAGGLATLAASYVLAGWPGLWVLIGLAVYAQMQLLLADYIQHYGLRRQVKGNGKPEPAGPQHSWNAPHWYSAAMMLNAPHHSDHHLNPSRKFPALRLEPERMPVWPYSMPTMATLALVPPLWRRVMDPRVLALQAKASGRLETGEFTNSAGDKRTANLPLS